MSVTSNRRVTIETDGDIVSSNTFEAAENDDSPGKTDVITLAAGDTTITVPNGGTTPTGVTIFPPAGNATDIILKGIAGDTGIILHHTDPTSLGIDDSVASFVLTVALDVVGVRLFWS